MKNAIAYLWHWACHRPPRVTDMCYPLGDCDARCAGAGDALGHQPPARAIP